MTRTAQSDQRSTIDINCDMGEGFGTWTVGDGVDDQILPMVSSVNVAAGFHAGDPLTMSRTVEQAHGLDIGIGVHPGFRDLVGFGRRHIAAAPEELVADVLYQLGALREFLRYHGAPLQHLKLHGALYMHAAADEPFADALTAALQRIDPDLPVLVMAGSTVDVVASAAGQPVVREFYADRHYGDDGRIVFTRDIGALDADAVAAKVLRACQDGTVETVTGGTVPIDFDSVCLHSDTPGALELMTRTRAALDTAGIAVRSFAR
ncbi:5-oxoprolinase subunit PxpA [Nakamurella flava]|uniref:5-oxoprolinase subunit PxpA n=1 Tax=Nakamurella flava TaxID=2576308 RepID=A0A4U6QJZ1_9ACTN|nr:5-oxoprolinase subunit PxpA [Nakamurella flava]TKV60763.1 5-oxoprolinase subunit PxpA [Nakamurella flava]